jgi:hypothetical protein
MAAGENRPSSPMSGCVHGKDRINQCLRGLVYGDASSPFCKTQVRCQSIGANVSSNRWIPQKPDDPRPAIAVAARAANVVEGNADRRVRIAAFHGQIEIDDGVARITRDDEPVMLHKPTTPKAR